MSAYTAMIREIAADGARVNRWSELIAGLTDAEIATYWLEFGEDDATVVYDYWHSRGYKSLWEFLRGGYLAHAAMKQALRKYAARKIAEDVRLAYVPADADDYRAEQADRKRDADIADGISLDRFTARADAELDAEKERL